MPKRKAKQKIAKAAKGKVPRESRIHNARRRLAVATFLAKSQESQRVCGECGQPVGPAGALYARDPITGRRSSSIWCDDCYERAILRGDRQRGAADVAVRKVA